MDLIEITLGLSTIVFRENGAHLESGSNQAPGRIEPKVVPTLEGHNR